MTCMENIDDLINASKEQKGYLQSALMFSPICWKDGKLGFNERRAYMENEK